MIRKFFLLLTAVLMGLSATARERQNFDKGWRFILADSAQMAKADYNDNAWRVLDVPHDWAREGDF
jgi:beta-galactosidase